MVLSEKKVGDEFYMDGLSYPDNNPVKTVCTLIEYRGRYRRLFSFSRW